MEIVGIPAPLLAVAIIIGIAGVFFVLRSGGSKQAKAKVKKGKKSTDEKGSSGANRQDELKGKKGKAKADADKKNKKTKAEKEVVEDEEEEEPVKSESVKTQKPQKKEKVVEEEGWETIKSKNTKQEAKTAAFLREAKSVNQVPQADSKKKGKTKKPDPVPEEANIPGAVFATPEPKATPKKQATPKKVAEKAAETAEAKDPQKELFKLKKKLRECQGLVDRKAAGEKLLDNQETKIANKPQILADIAKIDPNDPEVVELLEEMKQEEKKRIAKENEEALKYLAEMKAKEQGKVVVPETKSNGIPNDPFANEKKKKKGYVDPWMKAEQQKATKEAAKAVKQKEQEQKEPKEKKLLSEREKTIMNVTKKLKEIEELERKQHAGEKLAANQLPKLEKKKGLQEELKLAEAMLEPWQEEVSGMVVELMKPLHGVWVSVPGYEEAMPLYAAHCDPPVGADNLAFLLRKFRVNQRTKVRVRRDKTLCQMSEEDEAENQETSERIMKQLTEMKEEADKMEETWKNTPGWSNSYDATVKRVAKFGVFVAIGPSADILVHPRNMPSDLLMWDSDLKETVPDGKEICPKNQVQVKVRYNQARDQFEGSIAQGQAKPQPHANGTYDEETTNGKHHEVEDKNDEGEEEDEDEEEQEEEEATNGNHHEEEENNDDEDDDEEEAEDESEEDEEEQ